jgi:hypothetical protein
MVILFYCGIRNEHGTTNWDSREGVVTQPTPNTKKTFLTVPAEWTEALSCRMMAFYRLPFPNEVTSTMMFVHEICMHCCTYTPI